MRGILGGLFDPIHFGHIRSALALMEALDLLEVRLVPCGQPTHRAPPQAGAEHRWNMVKLVADGKRLVADDRELRRGGPSYMHDTMHNLREEFAEPLCLLIGADVLPNLPNWHRAEELIQLCHVAVAARSGHELEASLPEIWRARCSRDAADLQQTSCGRIYLHQGSLHDYSSTRIRELVRAGTEPRYCLPGGVWAYIREHRLYVD